MTATYEKIATTTLGSASSSVTFSSISSAYTDLVIIINGAFTSAFDSIEIRANGDSGSNYSRTILSGNGSSASSSRTSNSTSTGLGLMGTENSTNVFNINNYSNTTTYKTFLGRANSPSNAARAIVGLWRSTAAINSLEFFGGSFITGSTFTLYGILKA